MLKLRQLQHARSLAKYGNFHRAATAENISQPAFSRSIRNLEDALGVSLFDRLSSRVTPTVYGEALLRRADSIFTQTQELKREIQLLRGLDTGNFSVAMGVYAAEISANQALGRLIERHPNLHCHARLTNWRDVAGLVLSRAVDLGIAEISVTQGIEDIQVELVAEHALILFCRRGHPLLGRKKVSKADLDQYPLTLVRIPPRMAGRFPGKGKIDPDTGDMIPSLEVDELTTARAAVLESDAFGTMTPLQIEPWLRSGEFEILPYKAPWLKLEYGFIYLRQRLLTPAAEAYMQLVRDIEKEKLQRNRALMKEWFPRQRRGRSA